MRSIYREILLLSFLYLVRLSTGHFCNIPGNLSLVTCVSEWEFMFDDSEMLLTCPEGMWCANTPEVCTSWGMPACRFLRDCPECGLNSTGICTSENEYVDCIDGRPDHNLKKCEKYCGMLIDENDVPNAFCNKLVKNSCTSYPTTVQPETTTPEPTDPEFECKSVGKFPFPSDLTCKKYFYCYADESSNGENLIKSMLFACPGDTVYDPLKTKCVVSTSFDCNHV